jgi:hypothetical protein
MKSAQRYTRGGASFAGLICTEIKNIELFKYLLNDEYQIWRASDIDNTLDLLLKHLWAEGIEVFFGSKAVTSNFRSRSFEQKK